MQRVVWIRKDCEYGFQLGRVMMTKRTGFLAKALMSLVALFILVPAVSAQGNDNWWRNRQRQEERRRERERIREQRRREQEARRNNGYYSRDARDQDGDGDYDQRDAYI